MSDVTKHPVRVYGASRLKHVTFYVHIASLAMCYSPPLVRDKLLGAPAFVKLVYYIRYVFD